MADKKNNNVVIAVVVAIIVIFIGMCWCNGDKNDTFTNTMVSGFNNTFKPKNNKFKDIDVIYFMSPTCPWCNRMTKVLTDSGVINDIQIVDVTQKEGQELAKTMGAADKGVPSFISKKNKTGTVGFKKSVDELYKALEPQGSHEVPTQGSQSELQNLQIVVFVSPSCGWCTKMKQQLADTNTTELVEVVDITTPQGQELAKKLLPGENSGVPACYSKTTGKVCNGFKPIVQIIEELK